MSAFAPYKKIVGKIGKFDNENSNGGLGKAEDIFPPGIGKFPIEWKYNFFGIPLYQKTFFGLGLSPFERGIPQAEPRVEKKEKFFIKNILKTDEDVAERQKAEKEKRNFDEEASKMETIMSNLGKSENGHRCVYCGKIYSRKYGLKIHIRTHTGYKPLKCKYCLRPFGDPSNLNKHVRLHARGQTPYSCQFCGKILVRRRDLERHVKSKHGPPP